ncbi:MAG: transposase [Bacteroidetes bacterium]|nr:transposase [Bacteroidota bacterium]
MTLYRQKYRAESIRLEHWDYSTSALYFVTICTKDKAHTLGEIVDGVFAPTKAGEYVKARWSDIPAHFPFVTLDAFVVMPNHVHGIIHISGDLKEGVIIPQEAYVRERGDAHLRVSTDAGEHPGRSFGPLQPNSLSLVINNYNAAVRWNCKHDGIPFAWQERFHEHIIRNDRSYHKIRWYIENNVAHWDGDSMNAHRNRTIQFPTT